jgi:hypothetical protein
VNERTINFIFTNEKFFKITSCLPPSLVQASPLALFDSPLNETLNWAEFKVEDKTVVSKYKDQVDINDTGERSLLQLIKRCLNLYD